MPGSPSVWFATSNDHKFEEARFVLQELGIVLRRLPSKGPELQSGDPSEVAVHAATGAYRTSLKPLFVEDTGLFIESLRGFPGTCASFAFQTLGLEGILKLMEGISARDAEFVSAVAYCDGSSEPRVFVGRLKGRVALRPLGKGGFGFDPVFVPAGAKRTLAQTTFAEKCAISHRASALRAFGGWLGLNRSR
ncbi:MAG: RdgB/HAM1 family non-canonical purine NTP pyrophosphatase [Nitrososphaerales archaeon]|jgi:XTP/dITP diphosphohydrolase